MTNEQIFTTLKDLLDYATTYWGSPQEHLEVLEYLIQKHKPRKELWRERFIKAMDCYPIASIVELEAYKLRINSEFDLEFTTNGYTLSLLDSDRSLWDLYHMINQALKASKP